MRWHVLSYKPIFLEMPKISSATLYRRAQEIKSRIDEIASACESESRQRDEAEDAEYRKLSAELQLLQMRAQSSSVPAASPLVNIESQFRANMRANVRTNFVLTRDIMGTDLLEDTGIIPVKEQDILGPVRLGLIWNLVGIPIQSGLAGTLRWPYHGKAVAQWADEKEALVDNEIDFDKLTLNPVRLGIAISATRESIEDSEGLVETIINQEMPKSITDAINDALFTTEGTYTASDGTTATRKVYGPFLNIVNGEDGYNAIQSLSATPTRAELRALKTAVAGQVTLSAPCWVMTEAMKATLEDVKVDEGSGRFLCEGDRVLGYPVFVTSAIGEGYVGFGDWSYQAAGFWGKQNIIVDPYTLARQNSVDFVLNARFNTVTLRKGAFALGQVATE